MKFYAAYLYADFGLSINAAGEQSASFNFGARYGGALFGGERASFAYAKRVGRASFCFRHPKHSLFADGCSEARALL